MGIEMTGEPAPEGVKISLEELYKVLETEDMERDFKNKGVHPKMFIMGVPVDQIDKRHLIMLVRVIGNLR